MMLEYTGMNYLFQTRWESYIVFGHAMFQRPRFKVFRPKRRDRELIVHVYFLSEFLSSFWFDQSSLPGKFPCSILISASNFPSNAPFCTGTRKRFTYSGHFGKVLPFFHEVPLDTANIHIYIKIMYKIKSIPHCSLI